MDLKYEGQALALGGKSGGKVCVINRAAAKSAPGVSKPRSLSCIFTLRLHVHSVYLPLPVGAAGTGRIMESSQNHEGWRRPLRSSSPAGNPTPPCLVNHVPKCHIYTVFELLQGWGLHRCPGQPGPTPDRSFSKEIFPNIQSEPPLTQLQAIVSCPIAS